MIKKIFFIIFIILFILISLKSCIKADVSPTAEETVQKVNTLYTQKYSKEIEQDINKTINGIDYIQSQTPNGKFGGILITSTIGEGPKTFNPWNAKDATSAQLGEIMFDPLLSMNAYTGAVEPKLAKNYTISQDGKTYTIYLRKGLKWSDGKSITAEDVMFTYKVITYEGFGDTSARDMMYIDGHLPEIKKLDNYTIQFVTKKPFAPFIRQLSIPIAPKHIFEPVCKKGKSYFNAFYGVTTAPKDFVTSGAFKLSEYVPAQRVIYKRNPNYYVINKKNQKLPYLDKYIVLIVGDLNNELLKFKAGEIDTISLRGANVVSFKKEEEKSDYKLYNLGPAQSTMFLTLNLNTRKDDKGKFFVDPKKQKWFGDKNFRTAIDYAIDRENMIINIANGVAKPLFTAEALPSLFLNKKIALGHPQNVNYSKELLKNSGFYLDKKGLLFDKDGNKVVFDLYTNAGNTEREAIGVMIKQDLAELGITVNFKPIEFNSLVNKLTNTFDWDATIMGLTANSIEPHKGKNVWDSNGSLHLFNQRKHNENDLFPWEKRINKIFNDAALELDFNKRKALYDEYQQIIYDENPIIYLYSPTQITAIRKKFGNIYPTTLGGVSHNIEEIYIK